ncbi:HdeD family acid-resistance protein, partial [Achromobacter aegrifaciens]|uniref:HdeD family acid-resistance protein n=1 Tax=Achromobacter aegrifaciens TaxID=1287736 RepID=UPI001FCB55CE
MANLVLLLLGVDYLRKRARGLYVIGGLLFITGVTLFIDALDNAVYFPLNFFAALLVLEGLATLVIAKSGVGGQRVLRYAKGAIVLTAGILVLIGHHHGHFALSMLFGLMFLVDGLIQCTAAYVVRYDRWRYVFASGVAEILLAIFFFQPYPTHYVGTVPYCLGLFLAFTGLRLLSLARRVRHLDSNPALDVNPHPDFMPTRADAHAQKVFDGPPLESERALTVHVWTPSGSAKTETRNYPVVNRYIAAVDINGVVSTGHAALESPEGVYISLYPAQEIDHSPEQFGTLLRATAENNVPGVYQPDYATESKAWTPSTMRVRIRNYDAAKLQAFWDEYRKTEIYNLTHRNCSSSVGAGRGGGRGGGGGGYGNPGSGETGEQRSEGKDGRIGS